MENHVAFLTRDGYRNIVVQLHRKLKPGNLMTITYKTLLGKSRRGMKIFSPENRLHSGVPPETAPSPSLVILSL